MVFTGFRYHRPTAPFNTFYSRFLNTLAGLVHPTLLLSNSTLYSVHVGSKAKPHPTTCTHLSLNRSKVSLVYLWVCSRHNWPCLILEARARESDSCESRVGVDENVFSTIKKVNRDANLIPNNIHRARTTAWAIARRVGPTLDSFAPTYSWNMPIYRYSLKLIFYRIS